MTDLGGNRECLALHVAQGTREVAVFELLRTSGLRVGEAREIAEKSTVIDCESDGHHSPRLFSLLLLVESSNLKLIFFSKNIFKTIFTDLNLKIRLNKLVLMETGFFLFQVFKFYSVKKVCNIYGRFEFNINAS